jgi:hypothetical protein
MGGQYADHAPSEYRFPFCKNIERRVSSKGLSRSCTRASLSKPFARPGITSSADELWGRRPRCPSRQGASPLLRKGTPRRVNQGSRAVQQHHHVQPNGHRQPRSGSTRRGPCSVGGVPHSAVRKWVQRHNVTKWPPITRQYAVLSVSLW